MQQGYNRNNNMRRRRKVCYFTVNKIEHIDFKENEFHIKRMCCSNYVKNEAKIVPYEKPLEVTARRSYVKNREI